MVAQLSHALEQLRSVLRLSEEEAQAMLEAQVLRETLKCPRCSAKKLYALKSERWRCSQCRYTFGLLAGRWVTSIRIPAKTWIVALKAFEAGLPAESMGQLTGLSRPTLYKVLNTIRLALAAQDPEALKRGNLLAAAKAGRYATVDLDANGGTNKEMSESFMKYVKIQASRHYSIPPKAFPLYFMEWELRFRRSGKPWFEELLVAITRPEAFTETLPEPAAR